MPCHTRMKRIMQGLLWLFLLDFGFLMVMSLEPGYLDFDNLPDTNFTCVGKVIGGYYADLETNCQMFHVCTIGQLDEPMDIRFLCLNGTVFDQETRVCERIDEVDCSKSEQFYSLNLELYGNTQPPILEEEIPVEIKRSSTTTTTTTTTTQRPSHPKPTSPPLYYTTSVPPTTTRGPTKVITSHHFPVVNSPDIRFNPEEINISLNPGSPPDITRSQVPISFHQQSFSNSERNTRVTVTTHTTIYKNDKPHRVPLLSAQHSPSRILVDHENLERPKVAQATQTPKSVVSYGLTHNQAAHPATPTEINYGFTYDQTEESLDYNTEIPPHPYQYQLSIANLRPPMAQAHPYHSNYHHTSSKRTHKINYPAPTTYRNHPAYSSSVKASLSEEFDSQRTDKPPRLQLPLPLLPTLPPLTFSSPAPFSLGRHIETKRYTSDHHSPPRIIISASASVSDNSGRRLNYSLGTIGASHLLGRSPASYDDYKEDDVGLDPFYHDVPKIKSLRHKRSASREEDIIKNDQEAADLLRYLFNWYSKREKAKKVSIPVASEDITEINEKLAPVVHIESSTSAEDDYLNLFDKISTMNATESNRLKLDRRDDTKNATGIEYVELLANKLEVLNKNSKTSQKPRELQQPIKLVTEKLIPEVILQTNNDSVSNQTELHIHQRVTSTSTTKKPKRRRNHRRRPNKSRTTPSSSKKPQSQRKSSVKPPTPANLQHGGFENVQAKSKSKVLPNHAKRTGRPTTTSTNVNLLPERLEKPKFGLEASHDDALDDLRLKEASKRYFKNALVEENKPNTYNQENSTPYIESAISPTEPEQPQNNKRQENIIGTTDLASPNLDHDKELLDTYNFNSEEQVETHESNQHEQVITTHDYVQTTSVNPEDQTELNKNELTTQFADLNDTQHDDDLKITTFEVEPEVLTTTLQPSHENLDTLPSSYTNEEYAYDFTSVDADAKENQSISNGFKPDSTLEVVKVSNKLKEDTQDKPGKFLDYSINQQSEHEFETRKSTELNITEDDSQPFDYESNGNQTQSHKIAESNTEFAPKHAEISDNLEYDLLSQYDYEDVDHKSKLDKTRQDTKSLTTENLSRLTNHEESKNASVLHEKLEAPLESVYEFDYEGIENQNVESLTENSKQGKSREESVDGNKSGSFRNTKSSTKQETDDHTENLNLIETTLTPTYENIEQVTLQVVLFNSEKNSKTLFNESTTKSTIKKNASTKTNNDFNQANISEKTTDNFIYDVTTLQPSKENLDNKDKLDLYNDDHKEIIKHNSKLNHLEIGKSHKNSEDTNEDRKNQTRKRGRTNFKTASRRTFEVTSEENEFASNSKSSTRNRYKTNNLVRNRKFISAPLRSSKNIDHPEPKPQLKVNHESQLFNEKHAVIPDYVDDNYEPLTYQKYSEVKEFEATTIQQTEDSFDEDTITNEIEHATSYNEILDVHDYTSSYLTETKPTNNENNKYAEPNPDDQEITETTPQEDETVPTTVGFLDYLTTEASTTEQNELASFLLTTQTVEITTVPTTPEPTEVPTTTDTVLTTTTNNLSTTEDLQTTSANTESTLDFANVDFTTYYVTDATTAVNMETTQATSVSPSSTTYSAGASGIPETIIPDELTTPLGEVISTNKYQHLKTRLPWYKRQDNSRRKQHSRHRFTTADRRKSTREKASLDKTTHVLNRHGSHNNSTEKILIDNYNNINNTAKLNDTDPIVSYNVTNKNHNNNNSTLEPKDVVQEPKIVASTTKPELTETTLTPEQNQQQYTTLPTELVNSGEIKEVPITDAPLIKSANPTKAKYTKIRFTTTPLSKFVRVELRRDMQGRRFTFNCFNKKIHQFYSDPRDCRLFHYCTLGYTKNQMVDMKFVCDLGTYFDDEKLICTKTKPARCV